MTHLETARARAEAFRDLHSGDGLVVLPNSWDNASAAMMVAAGFPAIGTTSAGIAFSRGFADGQTLTRTEMLEAIAPIVKQSPVPVSGDLEAGYGAAPEDVAATVAGAIDIGLAGCNIEDADPHSGHLYDFDLSVDRIAAGRGEADRRGVPIVLNARTDTYLKPTGNREATFREAVRRANAYLEVGADCVFVPGPQDHETLGRLVKSIDGPLNVLAGIAGQPGLGLADARRLGVRRVSIGGSLMLTSATLVRSACERILLDGVFDYARDAVTNSEMNRIMGSLPSPRWDNTAFLSEELP